ncbi:MAG: hypothetical protein DHS20C05_25520 [Hyphococcus sp.]|nr:MAG: hypothetical protein DHS20C05_25520 [Marinicaulis sp.]
MSNRNLIWRDDLSQKAPATIDRRENQFRPQAPESFVDGVADQWATPPYEEKFDNRDSKKDATNKFFKI